MRTFIIALIVCTLLPSGLCSQSETTWPKPGATWEYCATQIWPWQSVWSKTYAYTFDTTIANRNYAVIDLTHIDEAVVLPDDPESLKRRIFIRQSGDIIYRFVNEQDYIFMVNGLNPGDAYSTFRSLNDDWSLWSCTDEMNLQVTEVSQELYGSITYRVVRLRDMDPFFTVMNPSSETPYYFMEGIGLLTEYPFTTYGHTDATPSVAGNLMECIGLSHEPTYQLRRYYDNEIILDLPGCSEVSTRNATPRNTGLQLYPNPASTTFTLHHFPGHTFTHATLHDMQGREVISLTLLPEKPVVDVQFLPKGMYFVRATSTNGNAYMGKIMVR